MKNALILITFLILTILLFYIENIYVLFLILLVDFIICLFRKISITQILNYNKNIFLYFILIISILNIFLSGLKDTFLITLRLFVACNMTFILRNFLPTYKLINALEFIFIPLKLFKINIEKISIILNIGINFITIFVNEIDKINSSLLSKGIKNNSILKLKYISKLLLPMLFKKTRELDFSLKSKNYIE